MIEKKKYLEVQNVSLRFKKFTQKKGSLKETLLHGLLQKFKKNKNRLAYPSQTPSLSDSDSDSDSNSNSYNKNYFWGLRDISLTLHTGDRLGIIGLNGAGKSTLLKVISNIYSPTLGKVIVRGRIAPLIEIGAWFNGELTGRENIFFSSALLLVPKKIVREHVESIIDFSGLAEFIDTPVKYYSTGMNVRLSFTIATEFIPEILILDELYAGGDHDFITRASLRLRNIIKNSQSMIVVSHDFKYILEFCTRVIVLEHGQIIHEGLPKEMIEIYSSKKQKE